MGRPTNLREYHRAKKESGKERRLYLLYLLLLSSIFLQQHTNEKEKEFIIDGDRGWLQFLEANGTSYKGFSSSIANINSWRGAGDHANVPLGAAAVVGAALPPAVPEEEEPPEENLVQEFVVELEVLPAEGAVDNPDDAVADEDDGEDGAEENGGDDFDSDSDADLLSDSDDED